jgi:hypothetical protein
MGKVVPISLSAPMCQLLEVANHDTIAINDR